MLLRLINHTPLAAHLAPQADADGQSGCALVAKSTWDLRTGRLLAAELQQPMRLRPQQGRLGDLALDDAQARALAHRLDEQVVWLDHDLSPPKPAFDVLLAGHVTAPPGHTQPYVDAALWVGEQHQRSIRAHVPRWWGDSGLGPSLTQSMAPVVARVPMTTALADWPGGCAHPPGPLPLGQVHWLPMLESPTALARRGGHPRMPAGFGGWPSNAPHRLPLAGTYDEHWRAHRNPAPPLDFNPRFYNLAHPDLQFNAAPAPGTPLVLINLAREPLLHGRMPGLALRAQITTAGGQPTPPTALVADTLVIEPDANRLCLLARLWLALGTGAAAVTSVRLYVPSRAG